MDWYNRIGRFLDVTLYGALIIGLGAHFIGKQDAERAKKTLEPLQLAEVQTLGKAPYFEALCTGFIRTSFTAVNSKQEKIQGVVCSGQLCGKDSIKITKVEPHTAR